MENLYRDTGGFCSIRQGNLLQMPNEICFLLSELGGISSKLNKLGGKDKSFTYIWIFKLFLLEKNVYLSEIVVRNDTGCKIHKLF